MSFASRAGTWLRAIPLVHHVRASAKRLGETQVGQKTKAVVGSRTFQWTTGAASVGFLAFEIVDHFAAMHEEHGLAELCFGLHSGQLESRREKEAKLRAIVQNARREAEALRQGKQTGLGNNNLNNHAEAAHQLLYPTITREDMRKRRETYGAVKWTDAALAVAAAQSPLVEIGAGRGQWQRALMAVGADCLAFDDSSSPGTRSGGVIIGAQVAHGGEEMAETHSDRTLLLVFPDPGPMAFRCLQRYKGSKLVYVGEGRSGVNADDAFFDMLLSGGWRLTQSESLDCLPESYERLFVLQRDVNAGLAKDDRPNQQATPAPPAGATVAPTSSELAMRRAAAAATEGATSPEAGK